MNYLEFAREYLVTTELYGLVLMEILIAVLLFLFFYFVIGETKKPKIKNTYKILFSILLTIFSFVGFRTFHLQILILQSKFLGMLMIFIISLIILIVSLHRILKFPPIIRKGIWILIGVWLIFKYNFNIKEELLLLALGILLVLIIFDKTINKNLYNAHRKRLESK